MVKVNGIHRIDLLVGLMLIYQTKEGLKQENQEKC